jgi:hypothetical protein
LANRLSNPFPQFVDSTGAPYSGGTLYFYAAGTSTPLAFYTDRTLSTSGGTSLTLNSSGRATVDVYLQNLAYKIVLKDSSANTIWTADYVYASDFSAVAQFTGNNGNPNGSVAGTAASSGVPASSIWDYTNGILYICTTTGTSSTAVWTAVNPSGSTPVSSPQGRLTLTSATPVLAADVSAGTSVYYTPFVGNLIPIFNGSVFVPQTFSELTLTLAAQHLASSIYDIFVWSDSGTLRLGTGPAWATVTAGSGARGTGAGTTQLTKLLGYYVNTVSMTVRNGGTTYTVDANKGTYVGSMYMDGTNGQVSCHVTYGQSRKWAIWNAYNRKPIILLMGDTTASWNYTTNTIRQSRATAGNTVAVFTGLPEESVKIEFRQKVLGGSVNAATSTNVTWEIGLGLNSTTAYTGQVGSAGASTNGAASTVSVNLTNTAHASHVMVPTIGLNNINSLERTTSNTGSSVSVNYQGGDDDMLLIAEWLG